MITMGARSRLEVERSSLLATIAREETELATPLDDKGEDLTASQQPADVASDLSYREFTVLTELTLREELAEIDDLARIAHGTYAYASSVAARSIPSAWRHVRRPRGASTANALRSVPRRNDRRPLLGQRAPSVLRVCENRDERRDQPGCGSEQETGVAGDR